MGRLTPIPLPPDTSPLLLTLQQPTVGGDLKVQAQLDDHELLVLMELSCHVLLGPLQGGLQPGQFALSAP